MTEDKDEPIPTFHEFKKKRRDAIRAFNQGTGPPVITARGKYESTDEQSEREFGKRQIKEDYNRKYRRGVTTRRK